MADLTAIDEVGALRTALRLLGYLPRSRNDELAPFQPTSDPVDRATRIDTLLKAFTSPSGFNTPFDAGFIIQQLVDHGDYFRAAADARGTPSPPSGASAARWSASWRRTARSRRARSTSPRP
ncbi:MAG: carboxyl transferase domain-containing protein [Myxococcota bacterium]